jgi:flavin-dependent dehydrogenase
MTEYDAIVVGGGPVGLAAAIEAKLAGLSVVVIEPRSGAIDKACGEGLMPGAIPLLERLGVSPSGKPLVGVNYRGAQRSVQHRFTHGPGLGVRRTELHTQLTRRAHELGVVFMSAAVDEISQEQHSVTAHCGEGATVRAKYLIGCDGLHSSVARLVGLSATVRSGRKKRYGIRQHFEVTPWSEFIEVHYTAHAEVYITPVSDHQVGVAVLGRKANDFDETIAQLPELARRLEGALPASERSGAGSFPRITKRRTVGRVLLVGDASGYVDAITGEGLRLGFAQARAAIECIGHDSPKNYERRWRQVTRDFRVLTYGLVSLANSPLRGLIVPISARFPALFGYVVDRLAR